MVWIMVAIALLLLLGVIAAIFRLRRVVTADSTFNCYLRPKGATNWRRGLAQYNGSMLSWFPIIGLSIRPQLILARSRISIVKKEQTDQQIGGVSAATIVEIVSSQPVDQKHRVWQLALSPESALGLYSWIEAAPPGGDGGWL